MGCGTRDGISSIRALLSRTYPPTKAIRVQYPAGSLRIVAYRNRAVGRRVFSGYPFSPTPSFRRCSVLTSIIHIGSQDLDVKSRPNLSTLHATGQQSGTTMPNNGADIGRPHAGRVVFSHKAINERRSHRDGYGRYGTSHSARPNSGVVTCLALPRSLFPRPDYVYFFLSLSAFVRWRARTPSLPPALLSRAERTGTTVTSHLTRSPSGERPHKRRQCKQQQPNDFSAFTNRLRGVGHALVEETLHTPAELKFKVHTAAGKTDHSISITQLTEGCTAVPRASISISSLWYTACLITHLNIKPGRDNLLRKSQVQKSPPTASNRADIGQPHARPSTRDDHAEMGIPLTTSEPLADVKLAVPISDNEMPDIAEQQESGKGDNATHINCPIAAKRKALNWSAVNITLVALSSIESGAPTVLPVTVAPWCGVSRKLGSTEQSAEERHVPFTRSGPSPGQTIARRPYKRAILSERDMGPFTPSGHGRTPLRAVETPRSRRYIHTGPGLAFALTAPLRSPKANKTKEPRKNPPVNGNIFYVSYTIAADHYTSMAPILLLPPEVLAAGPSLISVASSRTATNSAASSRAVPATQALASGEATHPPVREGICPIAHPPLHQGGWHLPPP
ncbi:hypothetical protein PR048_006770 [Dryococelus australis]|uniref:Uncharacterized protein n=1 Tax=Dryococelus australis TaxID=614101 RepID=A0ABQ9ID73_9NEOP|nr:hypothetical protein PR048_006770 [Dryococelus australis]